MRLMTSAGEGQELAAASALRPAAEQHVWQAHVDGAAAARAGWRAMAPKHASPGSTLGRCRATKPDRRHAGCGDQDSAGRQCPLGAVLPDDHHKPDRRSQLTIKNGRP